MLINVGTTFSHIGLIQDIHQDFHGYNSRSKLTYVRLLQSANRTIGHQLILLVMIGMIRIMLQRSWGYCNL